MSPPRNHKPHSSFDGRGKLRMKQIGEVSPSAMSTDLAIDDWTYLFTFGLVIACSIIILWVPVLLGGVR